MKRRRSLLLVGAVLAVCLAFGFSGTGMVWFWTEAPWFGVVLGAVLAAIAKVSGELADEWPTGLRDLERSLARGWPR